MVLGERGVGGVYCGFGVVLIWVGPPLKLYILFQEKQKGEG